MSTRHKQMSTVLSKEMRLKTPEEISDGFLSMLM